MSDDGSRQPDRADHARSREEVFARQRRGLLGLAYRMLGNLSEAEDMVQETWLRFTRLDLETLREPEAYLRQIVARLCLDELKTARRRREEYVGPWLPEPVDDARELAPSAAVERVEDLSFALMVALEELSAAERAALLLHDVFDASYEETAEALKRSAPACRQLVSRARRRLRRLQAASASAPPNARQDPASGEQRLRDCRRLLEAFVNAVDGGDVEGLERVLARDVVLTSDGGGRVPAALHPIRGFSNVSRFLLSLARKQREAGHQVRAEQRELNGEPALVVFVDGELSQTMAIELGERRDERRIQQIFVVRNPEKLARLQRRR